MLVYARAPVKRIYARILCISRVYMQRTTMRRWWLWCRWLFAGREGGVALVASAIKCAPTRKLTCSRLAFIETPRARDRNSKVQACLRVMQIGLKAERAAFTNAPLALSLPSPVLSSVLHVSSSARVDLKAVLSLSESCSRLRRVT